MQYSLPSIVSGFRRAANEKNVDALMDTHTVFELRMLVTSEGFENSVRNVVLQLVNSFGHNDTTLILPRIRATVENIYSRRYAGESEYPRQVGLLLDRIGEIAAQSRRGFSSTMAALELINHCLEYQNHGGDAVPQKVQSRSVSDPRPT